MSWRTIRAEGRQWEVRAVSAASAGQGQEEVLEFRSQDANLPARRVAVQAGRLPEMDELALMAAFNQARPLGGDFYGRPGKQMPDAR